VSHFTFDNAEEAADAKSKIEASWNYVAQRHLEDAQELAQELAEELAQKEEI
jgi:hypothetical protein